MRILELAKTIFCSRFAKAKRNEREGKRKMYNFCPGGECLQCTEGFIFIDENFIVYLATVFGSGACGKYATAIFSPSVVFFFIFRK